MPCRVDASSANSRVLKSLSPEMQQNLVTCMKTVHTCWSAAHNSDLPFRWLLKVVRQQGGLKYAVNTCSLPPLLDGSVYGKLPTPRADTQYLQMSLDQVFDYLEQAAATIRTSAGYFNPYPLPARPVARMYLHSTVDCIVADGRLSRIGMLQGAEAMAAAAIQEVAARAVAGLRAFTTQQGLERFLTAGEQLGAYAVAAASSKQQLLTNRTHQAEQQPEQLAGSQDASLQSESSQLQAGEQSLEDEPEQQPPMEVAAEQLELSRQQLAEADAMLAAHEFKEACAQDLALHNTSCDSNYALFVLVDHSTNSKLHQQQSKPAAFQLTPLSEPLHLGGTAYVAYIVCSLDAAANELTRHTLGSIFKVRAASLGRRLVCSVLISEQTLLGYCPLTLGEKAGRQKQTALAGVQSEGVVYCCRDSFQRTCQTLSILGVTVVSGVVLLQPSQKLVPLVYLPQC